MTSERRESTLLLVDDDWSIVELLGVHLSRDVRQGVTIETETDPKAALARILRGGVDILLTDLEMPDLDGIELLRTAKAISPHTQVLFITGNSTQTSLVRALKEGASDYLLKPVAPAELARLVQEADERQRRWLRSLRETNDQEMLTAPQ